MKSYHFGFIVLLLVACSGPARLNKEITAKTNNDSTAIIHSLAEISQKSYVVYITPAGKKILLKRVDSQFEEISPVYDSVSVDEEILVSGDAGSLGNHGGADDPFKGSIRPTVKTSYSTKPYENFPTIPALYRSLESKEFMNNLSIGNSDARVANENRNVKVKTAYLYTITIETDNDFHLLIGNTPVYDPSTTRVFNAEIPGVPRDGSETIKQHVRDLRRRVLHIFTAIPLCGRKGYLQEYTKITISGSLFYDSHHKSTPAKCKEVIGESAWEIHPVWDITRL